MLLLRSELADKHLSPSWKRERIEFLEELFLDPPARSYSMFSLIVKTLNETLGIGALDPETRTRIEESKKRLEEGNALIEQKEALKEMEGEGYDNLDLDQEEKSNDKSLVKLAQEKLEKSCLDYFLTLQQEKRLAAIPDDLALLTDRAEAKDPLKSYIPLKATLTRSGKGELFDLEGEVRTFLASDKRVFLLQAGAGAGKTTFALIFEHTLWGEGEITPIYIPLRALGQRSIPEVPSRRPSSLRSISRNSSRTKTY